MARAMVRLCVCAILLLMVIVAEGDPQPPKDPKPPKAPKPKHVKCKDHKHYPACHHRNDLYCPVTCPRNCTVDCITCQPLCTPPPPPPPSPPPPPPPPKQKKRKSPPPHIYSSPPPPTHVYPSPPPPPTNVSSFPPPLPPTPTPPPSTSGKKKARCKNKNFEKCYWTEHTCPSACPDYCEVDCVTCSPICNCNKPGAICQDPRFVGADGITFYFHGKKDKDFCIVSDSNLHINAHFIGRRNPNMKRDFTWIQSLGILFGTHRLFVGAQKTSIWNDAIDRLALTFDGEPIVLPAGEGVKWSSASVTIARSRDVNSLDIEVEGNFKIKATVVPITEKDSRIHNYGISSEEDCFAHLDLSFKFYSLSGDVNGVLGQTYGNKYVSKVKMGVLMPVVGGDREFASSSIFSTDCAISRFSNINGGLKFDSSETFNYGNLNCSSGMDGQGVVCRR